MSLGAEKGQEWLCRTRAQLNVPIISHLGAVLNFTAGSVKRAPKLLQNIGAEWLWRIKEQPRLFKRYLVDGIQFIALLIEVIYPYKMLKQRLLSATISDCKMALSSSVEVVGCLLYTSPSPRDQRGSRMPSSA